MLKKTAIFILAALIAVPALALWGNSQTFKVTADTWIYQFRPNKNYGDGLGWMDVTNPAKPASMPRIFIGFGGEDKKIGLFKFDLSKMKKDKPVKKAIMSLYNDQAGSDAPAAVDAMMVITGWDEMKVTYKSKPAASMVFSSSTLRGAIGPRQSGKWYKFDVTKVAQAWQQGKQNYGIMLVPQGESGVDFQFICKEAKGHEAHFPKLEVNY